MKEAAIDFADRLAQANRDYRLGLVTFEDYVIRDERVFTRSAREFKSWVGALRPAGGGDIPENSLDALLLASRFPFRARCPGRPRPDYRRPQSYARGRLGKKQSLRSRDHPTVRCGSPGRKSKRRA